MSKEIFRKVAVALAALDDFVPLAGMNMLPPEKDRMVKPKEAVIITGKSLTTIHRDKKAGKWVPTFRLGDNSIAYKLSDLLALNASRAVVTAENTNQVAPGAKRGRKPKHHGGLNHG